MNITALLNELGKVRFDLGIVRRNLLDTPLGQELDRLEKIEASVERSIKTKVKFCRATVKGNDWQVVPSVRSSWDTESLGALAVKYGIPQTELEGCQTKTKVWSIRKVGK